jgi:hypothetical protein
MSTPSALPADLTWEDEVLQEYTAAGRPQVLIRTYSDRTGAHVASDVWVGGWMLRDGRYRNRRSAEARARTEIDLARTRRAGHFGGTW